MTIITVKYADPPREGKKSAKVKDHDGNVYFCSDMSILGTVGKTLNIEVKNHEYSGRVFAFIQKWAEIGGAAPQVPVSAPQMSPAVSSPVADRDASIVAQTLCKTIENNLNTPSEAWNAYVTLYGSYIAWVERGCPTLTKEGPAGSEPVNPGGFSDDIPF